MVDKKVKIDSKESKKPTVTQGPICRGRMPLPLVKYIRYNEEGSDTDIARKYFTTAGKVSDIRKGRNFGYINTNTTFSKADIEAAKAQLVANFSERKKRGSDEVVQEVSQNDAKYSLDVLSKIKTGESTLASDREKFKADNK